jgi:ABC-type Fe3+-citrate transport system substrate-binding protein
MSTTDALVTALASLINKNDEKDKRIADLEKELAKFSTNKIKNDEMKLLVDEMFNCKTWNPPKWERDLLLTLEANLSNPKFTPSAKQLKGFNEIVANYRIWNSTKVVPLQG